MKTVLTFIVAITLIAPSAVLACDKTKTKDAKKANGVAAEKVKKAGKDSTDQKGGVLLTGSYIKQKINRNGRIIDSASQVIILDRETIERSGASDVKQLLSHQGVR